MRHTWWCLPQSDLTFPSIHESFQIDRLLPTFSAQPKYPLIIKPAQTSRQKYLMSSGHIVLAPTITVKSILDSHQLLECQVYP